MIKLTQMSSDNDGSAEKDGPKSRRIHLREISGDSESPLASVGYGLWHLMAPSGDSSQQVPEAPVLNPPKPKPAPPPQPVMAPAQEATPSPATDAVPPAAPAAGQQASATPPPAAGAKTPATSTA